MAAKLIVIVLLLVVLGSLGSALFYMMKDTGDSKRMVRALTVRISLSVVAFLLILVFAWTGVIEPNSVPGRSL